MTAPIVHHWSRQGIRADVFDQVVSVSISASTVAARRDWNNPPKGQLWERLAEVTLAHVIGTATYSDRLARATNRALGRAHLRREAARLERPRVHFDWFETMVQGRPTLCRRWLCTCGKGGIVTERTLNLSLQARANGAATRHLKKHRA